MYTVKLTNDDMPFRNDARFDVKQITLWAKQFESKREARSFFKKFAAKHNMFVFHNEAAGGGKKLYWS